MKRFYAILILFIVLLNISTISCAEAIKVIKLKDGSTLKGKVLQLNNGTYTLQTSNLGEITIDESDILSITSSELSNSLPEKSTATGNAQKAELQKQVQQIQGTILSDGGIMAEIQNMLEDENVKAMLSDPKLLEDVTSFDQKKIEQNTNVQNLMNNPKMKELMNRIQQKISAGQ